MDLQYQFDTRVLCYGPVAVYVLVTSFLCPIVVHLGWFVVCVLALCASLTPVTVLCAQELANWFIDCPRDRMKSAMSQLLIEILLPVAAVISLETTLPAVKKFVNILYAYCHEQAKKPRHVLVCDLVCFPMHWLENNTVQSAPIVLQSVVYPRVLKSTYSA